jgi:hypothetical protein
LQASKPITSAYFPGGHAVHTLLDVLFENIPAAHIPHCEEAVGAAVGAAVGVEVGAAVGLAEGASVALAMVKRRRRAVVLHLNEPGGQGANCVGATVGAAVGESVGESVGAFVGAAVGASVGACIQTKEDSINI